MQHRLEESSVFGYLEALRGFAPGEGASIEPAGDGNVNWVRRVRRADGRSFVLKQARPALERFPEYRADTRRIVFEARYLAVTEPWDAEGVRPEVLHFDERERVLILEDLGDAIRLDAALAEGRDVEAATRRVAAFLGRVHAHTRDPALATSFANDEMRRLHGDHVFHLPCRENDFPLSPALRERARAIWSDAELVARIDAAYERYLEPRGALVHADAQAGNVLLAERGAVLLDAEIAHVGDPAFDVGILMAHVLLHGVARGAADAARAAADAVFDAYAEAHGARSLAPRADALRYAGIEMLRRTIGAARVPAVERDEAGLAVLETGLALVRRA